MITFHQGFSTRIFLNEPAGSAPAAQHAPAPVEPTKRDEIHAFWWFLRGAPTQKLAEGRASARPRSGGSATLR